MTETISSLGATLIVTSVLTGPLLIAVTVPANVLRALIFMRASFFQASLLKPCGHDCIEDRSLARPFGASGRWRPTGQRAGEGGALKPSPSSRRTMSGRFRYARNCVADALLPDALTMIAACWI